MKRDYYEILGVDKSASSADIKRAFRRLAKQYHPDVSKEKDAESKFKEINEAYEVLSDESKRKAYDRFGHQGVDGNFQGFNGFEGFSGFEGFGGFEDFFSGFSGFNTSRSNPNGPIKGESLIYNLNISFMEAVKGCNKVIKLNVEEVCEHCKGNGSKDGNSFTTCPDCKGTGKVYTSLGGFFNMQTTCSRCNGTGKIIKEKCSHCNGLGYHVKTKEIDVKIPEGINDGERIVLRGLGKRGINGGPNGDVYIQINVGAHDIFERINDDIIMELPISAIEATLGTKVSIPTVSGEIELDIPSGSQHGTKLRLKNKGVKNVRYNSYGDQYVIVKIIIPKKISKEEKKLYDELLKLKNHSPNFFERLKNIFK